MKAYEFSWDKVVAKGYQFPDAEVAEIEPEKTHKNNDIPSVISPNSSVAPDQKADALLSPEDTSFDNISPKSRVVRSQGINRDEDFSDETIPSQESTKSIETKEVELPFEKKAADTERDETDGEYEGHSIEKRALVEHGTIFVARGRERTTRPVSVTRIGGKRSARQGMPADNNPSKQNGTLHLVREREQGDDNLDAPEKRIVGRPEDIVRDAPRSASEVLPKENATPTTSTSELTSQEPASPARAPDSAVETPTVSVAAKHPEEAKPKHRVLVAAEILSDLLMKTDFDNLDDTEEFTEKAKAAIHELGRAKAAIEIDLMKKGLSFS